METINFVAGSEERFFDFISKLNDKDKIAIVSHISDLDGITSAKIINSVIRTNIIKFVDYHEININFALELKKQKVKYIILSDLMIREKSFIDEVEKFAEILIIDHHPFGIDWNSEKTIFMNSEGYCAAYLCYYLFSKIQNIEKYDWLVACASVSDWCYNKNASWMISVYDKYGEKFNPNIQDIKKSRFYDLAIDFSRAIIYFRAEKNGVLPVFESIRENNFNEQSDLIKYADIVGDEIKSIVDRFEKEKKTFNNGFYFEFESKFPVKSAVSTELSEKYWNKTLIILFRDGECLELSARRQDGKVDMNKFVRELVNGFEGASGGGHFKAAGGFILEKDAEEFKKRLMKL